MRAAWSTFKLCYTIGKMIMRFFLGRNGVLSGERKTNATFFRPATMSLDPSGTALRWEKLPGWQRLLWRLSALYSLLLSSLLLLLWGAGRILPLPEHLRPGFLLAAHGATGALIFSLWFLRRTVERHGYRIPVPVREERIRMTEEEILSEEMLLAHTADPAEREKSEEKLRKGATPRKVWTLRWVEKEGRYVWEEEKVLPVVGVASSVLGISWPLRKEKLSAVHVPRNYHDGGKISISLPSDFAGVTEAQERKLESSVARRLGARELSASLQLEGRSPRILLSVPPAPPKLVTYADVEKFLLSSEEYRPFLGLTRGDEALSAEMIDDSPHIGVSAGPGAGKSMIAKLVAMQALRWGWGVVVLDWKKTKQFKWMEGMQGVTYISDTQGLHDFGVRVGEEVDIRKEQGMDGRANVLIIRDEWNITAPILYGYWDNYYGSLDSEEKKSEPRKSPALAGYAILDFAGREFGLFDFCVAQKFSARIFNGNADIRECFNIKLMARYSDQTKRMLVGNLKPFPRKSNIPGRWTVVSGEDVTVVQAPLITNEEAREYAEGGVPNPLTPFSSAYAPGVAQRPSASTTLGKIVGPGPAGPSQEELPVLEGEAVEIKPTKLSELVDELRDTVDPNITLNILQKAAKRSDSDFPQPLGGTPNRGWTYDPESVRMWTRKRIASRAVQEGRR